jgi:mono/diheme cytochrome c family protein
MKWPGTERSIPLLAIAIPLPVLVLPWLLVLLAFLFLPRLRGSRYSGWLGVVPLVMAVIGVVLLFVTLSGDPTPLSDLPNPVTSDEISVGAGADLFFAHCAECHGVDARGGGPTGRTTAVPPPSLVSGHLLQHTDGDIYYWISNGLPGGMPAWQATLSESERWQLVNYLRFLNRPTLLEGLDLVDAERGVCLAVGALPDDPGAARRVYSDRARLALHALAADSRMDRSLAGELLQAKARVEADLADDAAPADLRNDMVALEGVANAALRSIGIGSGGCQ